MERKSYKSAAVAAQEFEKYVTSIRNGSIKSMDLGFKKMNKAMSSGLEWHTLWTIAAMSGAGKSAFSNQLETNILQLNPDVCSLNFTLEMMPFKQMARKMSKILSKSTKEIYSDHTIDIQSKLNVLASLDITYVEEAKSVQEIKQTIVDFYKERASVNPNIGVIVFFDHMLLTDDSGEERLVIKYLSKMFADITNQYKISVIALSQLNRDIESMDRIVNPIGHYPMKKDIFGGDGIFQASDYVTVLHRPERLGIDFYGPQRLPTTGQAFLHFIKVREGEEMIIQLNADLAHNNLYE